MEKIIIDKELEDSAKKLIFPKYIKFLDRLTRPCFQTVQKIAREINVPLLQYRIETPRDWLLCYHSTDPKIDTDKLLDYLKKDGYTSGKTDNSLMDEIIRVKSIASILITVIFNNENLPGKPNLRIFLRDAIRYRNLHVQVEDWVDFFDTRFDTNFRAFITDFTLNIAEGRCHFAFNPQIMEEFYFKNFLERLSCNRELIVGDLQKIQNNINTEAQHIYDRIMNRYPVIRG